MEPDQCLSSEYHPINDISNFRCHFFGCVPFSYRLQFLDDFNIWSRAAEIVYASKPKDDGKNEEIVKDSIHSRYVTALILEGDSKRIDLLRRSESLKGLTAHVDASRNRWRKSPVYEENIPKVEEWRKQNSRFWAFSNVTMDIISSDQGELQVRSGNPVPSTQPGTQGTGGTHVVSRPSEAGGSAQEQTGTGTANLPGQQLGDQINSTTSTVTLGEQQATRAEASALALRNRIHEIIENYRGQQEFIKTNEQVEIDNENASYDLERDVKAQFIQLQREPYTEEQAVTEEQADTEEQAVTEERADKDDVGVMKPINKPVHDQVYKGQFPDQQLSIQKLTAKHFCRNSLHQKKDGKNADTREEKGKEVDTGTPAPDIPSDDPGSMIRYFHIPYNNMEWVKNAIERYYKQEGNSFPEGPDLVLRPQFWRGQEHGSPGADFIHSRYLRSLCESFSIKTNATHENNNHGNMVLFMPFLHWDIDRMRSIIAEKIERKADKEAQDWRHNRHKEKHGRQAERALLPKSELKTVKHREPNYYVHDQGSTKAVPRAIEDIFWNMWKSKKMIKNDEKAKSDGEVQMKPTNIFIGVAMDNSGRLRPNNPLAQYLIDAARLFEAMATYQDSQVIERYLFQDPPLHPRRSLDQAYFWKLRTTHRRDRDQVVYRFTRAEFAHRLLPSSHSKRELKDIAENSPSSGKKEKNKKTEVLDGWEWTGHGQFEDDYGCEQCSNDIRKLSRAIMVDQLWMWILDDDTILTCFPQRYGVGQKDPSGVHQSIRTRLKNHSDPRNHIRSVYDLGLIILDTAFDVLFDRTKTADKRPQVLDIFAESIGTVTNKQTIGFRHLWELTEELAKIYQSPIDKGIPDRLVLPLLNITQEGKLQREIRDIIDELDMMMHILQQQEEIITKYIANVLGMSERKETGKNDSEEHPTVEIIHFNSNGTWSSMPKNPSRKATSNKVREWQETIQEQQHASFQKYSSMLVAKVNDLIGLKQEQASVVQAYQAMKQGDETVRQGRAIMLFTVMTIIFLPLSFMTSLFGMNSVELTGSGNSTSPTPPIPSQIMNFWAITFKRQITIMFSVSFLVIVLALILAFSPPIRRSIGSFVEWLFVAIEVRSGFYKVWLARNIDIEYRIRMTKWKIYQKKEDVIKKRREEKQWKSWEADEVVMQKHNSLESLESRHGDLTNRIRTAMSKVMGKSTSVKESLA